MCTGYRRCAAGGSNSLLDSALAGADAAARDLPTGRLNAVLREAVREHATPRRGGRRIRLNYAHQGGKRPPLVVIHGRQTKHLPADFRRFLARRIRRHFGLRGTPLRIELRTAANPYSRDSA